MKLINSLAAGAFAAALMFAPASAWAYKIYVSNEKDNTITVIDSDGWKVEQTVDVGQRPRGILLSKDGKFLYVCASDDDAVQVFETATMKLVKTLPSGPDPELFILHPSGNPLYIANEDDNLVTVVDVINNKVLAEVPGLAPEPSQTSQADSTGTSISTLSPLTACSRVSSRP